MRVRLRFSKTGKVRWIGHRDVARVWERALRRAQLPVAYSGGFSPRPKVSFGLALSTGHESLAEYLDVDLDPERLGDGDVDVASLPGRLSALLPAGIDVLAAARLGDRPTSLQEAVTSCTWRIEAVGPGPDELTQVVENALRAPTLVVTRQRKGHEVTDDLRPAILSLEVAGATELGAELSADLATHPRGVRPGELLAALGVCPPAWPNAFEEGHVLRVHQWIDEPDGARREPLPVAAPSAPHLHDVDVRAS